MYQKRTITGLPLIIYIIKTNLEIKELTYNPCFLYSSGPVGILGMQIDNTLILVNNNFASKEEAVIKSVKIMIKDQEHFTSLQPFKFNKAQIKLNSKGIILTKRVKLVRFY